MKNGVPVITTSCGAEGICNCDKALMVADTAQEIVDVIASTYYDEEKLLDFSKEEINYLRKYFSQEVAINRLSSEFKFKEK